MTPRPGADSRFPSRKPPRYDRERKWLEAGLGPIAGVDEAGRGPLAGPVVAAAVILDPKRIPDGIDDSKRMSATRRGELFALLLADAVVAWAAAPAAEVDAYNIRMATLRAMARAVAALPVAPGAVLIDGRDIPAGLAMRADAIIGGDATCLSIAAASIVAKVARDALMARACSFYPGYGFSTHAGYGTEAHSRALGQLGPCALHRRSFAPVAELLERNEPA
jgi:ribonuclease HII